MKHFMREEPFGAGGIVLVISFLLFFIVFIIPTFTSTVVDDSIEVEDYSTVVVDDSISVEDYSTVVVDDSIGINEWYMLYVSLPELDDVTPDPQDFDNIIIEECYMFYVSLTSMDGVVFDMEVFREKYKDCNNYADLGLYVNDTLYTFMFEDLINMKKDGK